MGRPVRAPAREPTAAEPQSPGVERISGAGHLMPEEAPAPLLDLALAHLAW